MKKLYTATLEIELVVMAESPEEAQEVADRHGRDELRSYSSHDYTVNESTVLFDDWPDSLPYGGDGVMTCGEILAAQKSVAS